jgi:hypothetical protein
MSAKALISAVGVGTLVFSGWATILWGFDRQAPVASQPKLNRSEEVEVAGTCWEDHVGQRADYTGWIATMTYSDDTIGQVAFLSHPLDMSKISYSSDSMGVYRPPSAITLIPSIAGSLLDLSGPTVELHGLSNSRGDDQIGYKSTCDLTLGKRSTSLPTDQTR